MRRADAAPAFIAAPMADANPIAAPSSLCGPHRSSWYGPAPASALTARFGATDAAASSDVTRFDKSPASCGAFFVEVLKACVERACGIKPSLRLTSNGDASSGGGTSGGGDASPNACGANPNDDGASPNDGGGASPSDDDPSRDDDRGPIALLPA